MFFFFLMIRRPPRSTRTAHSFPTRHSSDLGCRLADRPAGSAGARAGLALVVAAAAVARTPGRHTALRQRRTLVAQTRASLALLARSEEHTSELQSLMRISYAVFCLKKKNTINKQRYIT